MGSLSGIFGDFCNCTCNYEPNGIKCTHYTDDTTCTEVYKIDIPGVDADKVTITKKWVNRTKELMLEVLIDLDDKIRHKEVINIETDLYNKYSYEVRNGRITITLYEIINPEPEFELV